MPRATKRKPKTPDQIIAANLRKMLGKVKEEVADAEEVWLDIFQLVLPCIIDHWSEDGKGMLSVAEHCVLVASTISDNAVEAWQTRWGTGARPSTPFDRKP